MLKVNLTQSRNNWRKQLAIGFLSVSLLGLICLIVPILSAHWSAPRPLQVEEQETVIAVTERLEGRVPKLAEWLKDFRYSVVHNDFELLVRHHWRSQDLVQQSGRTLILSHRFFDADSISQEQALLGILVTLHSQIEPESEVAYGE